MAPLYSRQLSEAKCCRNFDGLAIRFPVALDPRKHLFPLDGVARSTEHDTVWACWMAPAASADSLATTFGRQMTRREMERVPAKPVSISNLDIRTCISRYGNFWGLRNSIAWLIRFPPVGVGWYGDRRMNGLRLTLRAEEGVAALQS